MVVTKPFLFEGKRRLKYAEETIEQLRESVDTLIVVPNQQLLEISDPKISMLDAFSKSNEILKASHKRNIRHYHKTGTHKRRLC